MQTFTLFFGFAIVAIAMENLTSKLHFVKTSDADAKGPQGIQSRNDGSKKQYTIFGSTGKEKVIITDGNSTQEIRLNKTSKTTFNAKNDMITVSYINDKCCDPDQNVMFTCGQECKISTAHNPFPTDYQSNWNCSSCPDTSMQNTKKRMNLLSRQEKHDRCRAVAQTDDGKITTDDDCDNCNILEDGQFCQPGNYTILFKTKNQCKGVTFGDCTIPPLDEISNHTLPNAKMCSGLCFSTDFCKFYTFNEKNNLCKLLRNDYRESCKIVAGPVDKNPNYCLEVEDGQRCDAEFEEKCEYKGNDLIKMDEGATGQPIDCQLACVELGCKYWIHDIRTAQCTLKLETTKTCDILAGPREPKWQVCRDQELLN